MNKSVGLILFTAMLSVVVAFAYYRELYSKPNAPSSPPPSQEKKVIQANAIFYTRVFLNAANTYITFPYRFESSPQTMWLRLLPRPGYPAQQRLVMHPLLYQLSWPKLETELVTLYQRQNTYSSVEQFLSRLPALDSVLVDDSVITLTQKESLRTSPVLDANVSVIPDSVNYILTSYKPPLEAEGQFYFESTLDASTAQVNTQDEFVWQIEVPTASETNPFYLGDVHVDYRQ